MIDPAGTHDAATQNGSAWTCYAQLQAPTGFVDGSTVRITLEQNGTQTTVFEGVTGFPYLLNVQGQPGVSEGTAYVYTMDAAGNITTTTKYSGIMFYEQG